ncbi:S8 family peptidase [Virgibacillus kekensis]|uniref:S8 family peptidase n=1 Tax=Virgibacillus kekensis TaxID=202261 RepID=A0ABV9DJ14_9BACI
MFGYSLVQVVRANAARVDRPAREEILNLYKPFKWTPCIFHKVIEGTIKRTRKLSVIIEFEKDHYETGCHEINGMLKKHTRCKAKDYFPRVACCSADITPAALESILSDCKHVRKIFLNREVKALLDVAVPSVNAKNVVREGLELTGKGVNIAVIDTGVHPHRDLAGRIAGFVDFINNRAEPYDDNGHGTHCAGDAAGDGTASSFKYVGPAPEANIFGIKVLDKVGSGSLETVMQGVEWCIQYNEDYPSNKIDVISLSLGSTAQPYADENADPMVQTVEAAWASGITVCVAAGNEGPESRTIASPGHSDQVITVGALDDSDTLELQNDDEVASFSSRGPTAYGEIKPDILAPGVNIISLRSPGSYLDKIQKANRVDSDYFMLSGTSMATPICAGVVALVIQSNPELQPQEIKELLKKGAELWDDRDPNIYGSGYLNAERTIQ